MERDFFANFCGIFSIVHFKLSFWWVSTVVYVPLKNWIFAYKSIQDENLMDFHSMGDKS